jgi:hypothetical protein
MSSRSGGRLPSALRLRARRLALACLALPLLVAGCHRDAETWIGDLAGQDPWRRRMAALALRSVADEECERAFRALAIRLRDKDPEITAAIEASLRVLAARRPDLPARALQVFAAERVAQRALMARVLLELAAAGQTIDQAALDAWFAGEQASGVPARVEAARALLAEFGG